ncbi:RNA 2',3'-cyclic phosphodiesterase [Endozoicomonadaceae bacterium StTr2]
MRAFVAINLTAELSRQLQAEAMLNDFGSGFQKMRWLEPGNCHVTLRFLGEVPEYLLESFWNDARLFLQRQPELKLVTGKMLLLPRGKHPKVLAVTINSSPELELMAKRLEDIARTHGLAPEHKRFLPHITLARFSRGASVEYLGLEDVESCLFQVRKVDLMQSRLESSGAKYGVLDSVMLTG